MGRSSNRKHDYEAKKVEIEADSISKTRKIADLRFIMPVRLMPMMMFVSGSSNSMIMMETGSFVLILVLN